MKKMVPFALSLLIIAGLPACWGTQKPKPIQPKEEEIKRTSGPFPENNKEIGWEKEDYS